MAIPVIYNFRSVKARWTSAIVAVLGIAGTVGVFIAMLVPRSRFPATLGRLRLRRQRPRSCARAPLRK